MNTFTLPVQTLSNTVLSKVITQWLSTPKEGLLPDARLCQDVAKIIEFRINRVLDTTALGETRRTITAILSGHLIENAGVAVGETVTYHKRIYPNHKHEECKVRWQIPGYNCLITGLYPPYFTLGFLDTDKPQIRDAIPLYCPELLKRIGCTFVFRLPTA